MKPHVKLTKLNSSSIQLSVSWLCIVVSQNTEGKLSYFFFKIMTLAEEHQGFSIQMTARIKRRIKRTKRRSWHRLGCFAQGLSVVRSFDLILNLYTIFIWNKLNPKHNKYLLKLISNLTSELITLGVDVHSRAQSLF